MTKLIISKVGVSVSIDTQEPTDLIFLEEAAFRMFKKLEED